MYDFGSAYSTLVFLSNILFDVIKLDKTLIYNIVDNPKSRFLVMSLMDIFLKMGLTVVAEGVETVEQVDILKSINCNTAQGYFYSKPIRKKDFIDLL